ncbi:MAG: hypothetical protein ACE5G0_18175 [Rhodothermales bacterium]
MRPYNLLPPEALNGKGWLVRQDNPVWIPIEATGRYKHRSLVNASFDEGGTLLANLKASDGDYSALAKRHDLKDADEVEDFVRDALLADLNEVLFESCTVDNEEEVNELLKTEAVFSVPAYAQVAGDYIYFNPTPIGRVHENPLRLPERTFPVDLTYPRQLMYTTQFKIPEGYAVHEKPKNLRYKLPVDGGHYQRVIEVEGDILSIQTQFVVKRTVFPPKQYKYLRQFYDTIVATEAEQVVLKRVSESDGEEQGGIDL